MKLDTAIANNILTIAILGNIVSPEAIGLDGDIILLIEQHPCERIVLDFANVEHMDSTGLGVLVILRQHALNIHVPLDLAHVNEYIYTMITRTCAEDIFSIIP